MQLSMMSRIRMRWLQKSTKKQQHFVADAARKLVPSIWVFGCSYSVLLQPFILDGSTVWYCLVAFHLLQLLASSLVCQCNQELYNRWKLMHKVLDMLNRHFNQSELFIPMEMRCLSCLITRNILIVQDRSNSKVKCLSLLHLHSCLASCTAFTLSVYTWVACSDGKRFVKAMSSTPAAKW